MTRLLFVDDEPQILDGLRDALHRQRLQWDMTFCTSGPDALRAMDGGAFDVVVSDMRMPGMDGAELLRRIKERHPATVRIVLSGQADRELVMRLLPVSQQFLSKPCSASELRTVLERALESNTFLEDPVLLALIGEMGTLPSVPATYAALTKAIQSPDSGIGEISAIVARDAALSAKVLQIVNSAYFGLSHTVHAVPMAVNYLGLEVLKALALMVGIFAAADTSAIAEFSIDEAQREALLVAQVARRLVQDPRRRDEAFTTGALHDVGKLILATRLPRRYGAVLREAQSHERPLYAIERERIGASHASVGAVLLGRWGLPYDMVASVAHHHTMNESRDGMDPVMLAVHVADAMVTALLTHQPEPGTLDLETLERQGLLSVLPEWWTIARETVQGGLS